MKEKKSKMKKENAHRNAIDFFFFFYISGLVRNEQHTSTYTLIRFNEQDVFKRNIAFQMCVRKFDLIQMDRILLKYAFGLFHFTWLM